MTTESEKLCVIGIAVDWVPMIDNLAKIEGLKVREDRAEK